MKKKYIQKYKIFRSPFTLTLCLIVLIVFTGCGGAGSTSNEVSPEKSERFKELISSGNFEIEHEWVIPLGGQQITLIGNPNYVRFEGDSVDIYLPYFGVRHAGAGYSRTDGGIEFEGVPENLEINENNRKGNVTVKFRGEQGNEDLQFYIVMYPNGRAETRVNSSQRQSISYRGWVRELQSNRED